MHRHFSLGPTGFLKVSDYTGPLISSAQLWKWSKLIEGNAECWDGYFNFNHCLIAATNDKFRWWMDTNGKWCWSKAMSKDKWLCYFWRCPGNLIEKVSRPRIYCFFLLHFRSNIFPPKHATASKASQVEGPSWSTIPIVSLVWRVLNNRRRLLHTIACCIISRVLGRGPTELGTVRGNSCQASSVERARYSAAMSRCWD